MNEPNEHVRGLRELRELILVTENSLNEARKDVATLESEVAERRAELAEAIKAIPEALGMTPSELVAELAPKQPKQSAPVAKAAKATRPTNASKGRRLDQATRDAISKALRGGMKGTEAVKRFGVSYPTVHAMKQKLGLVTARK